MIKFVEFNAVSTKKRVSINVSQIVDISENETCTDICVGLLAGNKHDISPAVISVEEPYDLVKSRIIIEGAKL